MAFAVAKVEFDKNTARNICNDSLVVLTQYAAAAKNVLLQE